MELFIRLVDGQPFEHPIIGDNFRQAFPDIDTENLPASFARFTRYPMPDVGPYEIYQGVTYERDESGGFCDVHHVRNMSDDEKVNKQNQVKQAWIEADGFASWVFDEVTCTMQPPTPYPADGKNYRWDESVVGWVELA